MNWTEINKALDRYVAIFESKKVSPIAYPTDSESLTRTPREVLQHCHWMCIEARKFEEAKREKAQRWVCFIQGCLFTLGGYSIDEFKNDNRSQK